MLNVVPIGVAWRDEGLSDDDGKRANRPSMLHAHCRQESLAYNHGKAETHAELLERF